MKQILKEELCEIPDGVSVKVKARQVEVKGPRGTINKAYKHAQVEIFVAKNNQGKKQVRVRMWLAKRRQRAKVGSIASSIRNMIRGVTKGFKYKLRLAFSHFPIQVWYESDSKSIQLQNFLGQRDRKVVNALGQTTIKKTEADSYSLEVQGIDLDDVSHTCSLIRQSCIVKDRDIRHFLDGIYVEQKRLNM